MSYNPFELPPKKIEDILLKNISIDVDKLSKSSDSIKIKNNSSDTLSINDNTPLNDISIPVNNSEYQPVKESSNNNIFLVVIFILLMIFIIIAAIFIYNFINDFKEVPEPEMNEAEMNEAEMTNIQKIESKIKSKIKEMQEYVKSII